MKGRHRRCPATADYGVTEYDAHPHQCVLNNQHAGDHDFSSCPEHRRRSSAQKVSSG